MTVSEVLKAIEDGYEVRVTHPECPGFEETCESTITVVQLERQMDSGFIFNIPGTMYERQYGE